MATFTTRYGIAFDSDLPLNEAQPWRILYHVAKFHRQGQYCYIRWFDQTIWQLYYLRMACME